MDNESSMLIIGLTPHKHVEAILTWWICGFRLSFLPWITKDLKAFGPINSPTHFEIFTPNYEVLILIFFKMVRRQWVYPFKHKNVNKLVYSFLISSIVFAQTKFSQDNNLHKYEKGSLGVPRMFWVPNTFPLHNQPPYPDLCFFY